MKIKIEIEGTLNQIKWHVPRKLIMLALKVKESRDLRDLTFGSGGGGQPSFFCEVKYEQQKDRGETEEEAAVRSVASSKRDFV